MSKHKPSQRILAMALSVVMVLGMTPVTAMAQTTTDKIGEIIAFEDLSEETANREVPLGTSLEDLNLPGTLNATVRVAVKSDEEELIQDSGEPEQAAAPDTQDGNVNSDDTVSGNDIPADEQEPAVGTPSDTQKNQPAEDEEQIAGDHTDSDEPVQTTTGSAVTLGESGTKDEPKQPAELEFMEMNIPVPVEWTSSPDYDDKKEGTYIFTAHPVGFTIAKGVDLPRIIVTVDTATNGGIITSFEELPDHIRWQNTPNPYFPETLSGTVAGEVEGEITEIPVKWHTEEDYDEKSPQKGLYIFTVLLEGDYSLAGDLELPRITVYIPKSSGRFNLLAMGGTGTDSSPLEITTAAQLAEIATLVNLGRLESFLFNDANATANLVLMNDIDLSAYGKNYDDGKGWIPIGWAMSESPYTQYFFNGNFDGNSHIITGLYINRSDRYHQGLFGAIGGGSIVKNLGLVDVNIRGFFAVGGIAGFTGASQNNESLVQDCYVTGKISGNNNVGGVVGAARGIMDRCYSTATVSGVNSVGGIAGSLLVFSGDTSPAINNCAALNYNISGSSFVGRITGAQQTGEVTLANNMAFSGMEVLVDGSPKSSIGNANDHIDGLGKSAAEIKADGTLGGLFTNDNGWTTANGFLPGFGAVVEMPGHIIDIPTGQFFEGAGVESNEYKISTPQQLAKLAELVNSDDETTRNAYNDKHYKLMNDLDLSDYGKNYDEGKGWVPIGTLGKFFQGIFDGNNHKISGLYINRPQDGNAEDGRYYHALFGYIYAGSVKNLGLIGVDITGYKTVGGIAGMLSMEDAKIENCYVNGSIKGVSLVGGIAGQGGGDIDKCFANVIVTATDNNFGPAGGIAGSVSKDRKISNCYSNGSVHTAKIGGGIVGTATGTVENCYSLSTIIGSNNNGGIAGVIQPEGKIENCIAFNPQVSGSNSIGRVGGSNYGTNNLAGNIAFSGMKVLVNGSAKESMGDAGDNIDGLGKSATEIVGNTDNIISNIFTTVNGWTYTAGGLPILTGFADGVQDSTLPPHLVEGAASPYFYGTGADEANAYQISTPQQLAKLAELVNSDDAAISYAYRSKYYKLMKDIDLSGYGKNFNEGKGWTPIGIDFTLSFRGHFDGKGKTITGLYIRRTDLYTGLFGNINGGTVKNLGIINADIQAVSSNVGGMTGELFSGRIENCYVTGSVGGNNSVGGVAGIINYEGAIVINCYSSATVSATGDYAGGIAGFMVNTNIIVENCYSTGSISGVDYVGGIVGVTYSTTDTVRNNVALNPSVIGTGSNVGRVAGSNNGILQNNCAFSGMTGGGTDKTLNGLDGKDLTMGKDNATQAGNAAFWTTDANWDTANGTIWDSTVWTFAEGKLPTLKNVGGNQRGDGGLHLTRRDISGATVTVNGSYPYIGSNIFDYDLTLIFDGHTLEPVEDYTIDHSNVGKDVGSYNLTIIGAGNYKGSKTTSFSISKATPTATDVAISDIPSIDSYNGMNKEYRYKVIEPKTGMGEITVYYEGVDGTAYEKSTTPPINVGTYALTVDIAEGTNFTAATGIDVDDTFTIIPKSVAADMIGEIIAQTYTGSQIKPKPTVTDTAINSGTQLIEGVDFEYSYGENLYAGSNKGRVTITGKGNYKGTADKEFDIVAAEQAPIITQTANLTRGAKTLDLRTLLNGAMGQVSFTLADAGSTGSALEADGYTLTSGATIGEVKIDLDISALDVNTDGTPEYSSFTQANAITVTIVDKLTQDDFKFAQATQTKLYSDSDFTIAATGSVPGSTVTYTSDDETIATVNTNTGTVTIKKVGSTTIRARASETADYAEATTSYTLTVDKGTITITAKDKSAYRGSSLPTFTVDDYTVTGLRTGETLATLPTLAYETEPNMSQTGTIAIQASSAVAPAGDNYNAIVYVNGTLTISNRPSSGDSGGGSYTPPASPKPDKPNSPTQGEIKIPGTVDRKGNVKVSITGKTVTDAFEKALAEAKKSGNEQHGITVVLRVDTGSKAGSNVTVNLPKAVQELIIAKKIVNIVIVIDSPDIRIEMDLSTIKEIYKQARANVNITATRMDNGKLTKEAKKAIGNRPVFDLKVSYGRGKQVQNFGTGSVSVTIPYIFDANEKSGNIQAVYVDAKGKVHWLTNSVYDSVEQVLRFTTSHFSTYGIGYKQTNKAFTDIKSHWAKEDIEFVVSRGLLSVTSNTTFGPNIAMTRGMFITALGRLANADISGYTKSSFTDVKSDSNYMGYIEWANKNGILNGVDNNRFAPNQSITREQMAVIMSNYAKTIGFTLPKVHVENTFEDNAKISAYAKDAVKQMQMAGVISGKKGNLYDPQGTATRAEASAVLRRFVELAISSDTMQGWTRNDSGQWMYYENGKPFTGKKEIDGAAYTFDQYGVTADVPKNLRYTTYTVQKGDSFWSISRKLNCTMAELERLNNKSRFALIHPGDVLRVPEK